MRLVNVVGRPARSPFARRWRAVLYGPLCVHLLQAVQGFDRTRQSALVAWDVSYCTALRVLLKNLFIFFLPPIQNWLYKIASVRELVPRFYLETALLKCYKFSCDTNGFPAILERLTIMIRVIIILVHKMKLVTRNV